MKKDSCQEREIARYYGWVGLERERGREGGQREGEERRERGIEGGREERGKERKGGRLSPLLRIISSHTHEDAPRKSHGLANTVQQRRSRYTTKQKIRRAKI